MNKHTHGGRIFEAARELKIAWEDILDFSANINPLGQPPGLKEHLFSQFKATLHYPDVDASSLVKAISSYSDLPEDSIFPGAGSTPQIRMLSRFLSPKRPLILAPAFAEYGESLMAADLTPNYIFMREEEGFELRDWVVDDVASFKPDAIFVANPANPTGRLVPTESLERLLTYAYEAKVPLIIDEAFINFTDRPSLQARVLTHPSLVVLRSLTKVFAIPGLRLAYLAANPELVTTFKGLMEPWPINFMALEAGIYSLGLRDYLKKTPEVTKTLRESLSHVLSPYGRLIHSDCNFVLMKLQSGETLPLVSFLSQRGILIRDASNFKGLGRGYLRFAVRPQNEIDTLKKALRDFYA
ncbi:MAG: pyridoxal phosphate-dependent class II aminotransferase [Deltaproteobacteria bacterium]|nr:pyridoxal phosphate-dependent class II aminotransferase [Deltaproteobacteria bacterium]